MNADFDDRRPGLQPPQFGLGTLMTVISLLGLLFAVFHYVGLLGSVIVFFFILCVIAHVAGNAIGMQLRHLGSQPPPGSKTPAGTRHFFGVSPGDFAPVTRLRERYSLGRRNMAITLLGALGGGVLGGFALLWLGDFKSTWIVGVLGFSASAVLSGIWTFAASSFLHVMLGAWFHAAKDLRK